MIESYRGLFSLPENYTLDELKSAYRKQVKENHPDKFTDVSRKNLQEIIMVRINLAYERLEDHIEKRNSGGSAEGLTRETSEGRKSADLSYQYYRKGLDFLSKAVTKKNHRVMVTLGGSSFSCVNIGQFSDAEIKRSYIESFNLFALAEKNFSTVLDKFPDSIWAHDTKNKMKELEKFYSLYQRILDNLQRPTAAEIIPSCPDKVQKIYNVDDNETGDAVLV